MSQIIQGDALQVLPTFPEGCVDVVVTSPRYNFGKNYPGVPDNTPMDVYMDEMFDLAQALDRVIHPTGVLFLNVGTRAADPLHDMEVCQRFLQATFPTAALPPPGPTPGRQRSVNVAESRSALPGPPRSQNPPSTGLRSER